MGSLPPPRPEWEAWSLRSPVAAELLAWSSGDADARARLVEILARASPRDCAAAGFGCARRIDRPCREPATCVLDPVDRAGGGDWRQGPTPGACDAFYATGDVWIEIRFSADDRHRAVLWQENDAPVLLWVDGVPVTVDATLDSTGYWVGRRFLVVDAEGPEDHPMQSWGPGLPVTGILSVLIHDAETAESRVLVPEPTQAWTEPQVVWTGRELRLYPDQAALGADRPDRVLRPGPT